jgi:hypothetical protein
VRAQLKQPAKKQQTNNYKVPATLSSSTASRPKLSLRVLQRNHYTPPMHSDEVLSSLPTSTYPTTQSYRPATTLHPTTSSLSEYLTPAPISLPSMMHFNEALKRDSLSGNDDSLNPFSMSYAAMAGIDIQASQTFGDSYPHVSSLRSTRPMVGTNR